MSKLKLHKLLLLVKLRWPISGVGHALNFYLKNTKGKFDRSRYDLLSPLSVFVPIDKSGILYRSPSKTMASQI